MAGQNNVKNASKKNQLAAYKTQGRYQKNRIAKLERHLRNQPNDEKAQAALEVAKNQPTPRRAGFKPQTKLWTSQRREAAQLFTKVGLNGNHALGGKASAAVGDGEDKRFYGDEKYDKWQAKQWEREDAAKRAALKAGKTPKKAA